MCFHKNVEIQELHKTSRSITASQGPKTVSRRERKDVFRVQGLGFRLGGNEKMAEGFRGKG